MNSNNTTCCSKNRPRPSRNRPSSCTRPMPRACADGIYDEGVKASFVVAGQADARPLRQDRAAGSRVSRFTRAAAAPPAVRPACGCLMPTVPHGSGIPAGPRARRRWSAARSASDAELEFKQLMEGAPEFGGAAYNLGVLLRAQNRLEEAEAAFAEAARRDAAQRPGADRTRAGAAAARQPGRGRAVLWRALEVDAAYAPAHRNLGILKDVYQADPAAALRHLRAATRRSLARTSLQRAGSPT